MGRIRREPYGDPGSGQKARSTVWAIALYIRLSRDDGNEESESVTNQKRILEEYVAGEFDGECSVYDYYIDDGLSGTDDTRADFMRMIQDIEQGRVNCIICKTLARAFRNYSDQGYYLEYYFPQKKVRFISTGDPKIDTFKNPDAITGLEVPITGLMNDRYASRTSNDVRRTLDSKRKRGEFIGAFAPYGFLKDPANRNRLILDPDIVPIKRQMMDWIVGDRMSLSGVTKKLNEMGIPNPSAYKRSKGWKFCNPSSAKSNGLWSRPTVKEVLLSEANIGHMVQGKQRVVSYKVHDRVNTSQDEWYVVKNVIEPTFTKEEYDTLEQLLTRDTREAISNQQVYLFAGFVRCADCGMAMHMKPSRGTKSYACRTYVEKSKSACTRHSIREGELSNAVLASLQAQIGLVQSLADIVEQINNVSAMNTQSTFIQKALNDKQRELEKVKSVTDGLYMDWKSNEISREEYHRLKSNYLQQIEELTAAIGRLEEEQQRMDAGVATEDAVFQAFLKHRNIQELDRAILAEMVDTIYVHEGKRITIKFRFADELMRVRDFIEENTCEKG